jgi:N utilization substance protein A
VDEVIKLPESDRAYRAIVSDEQLSLAIGKEGQNARLAAKLTGFKIDIKSYKTLSAQE